MKLTILGAGGFRTPLLLKSVYKKLLGLGIDNIALYDIDKDRQCLVGELLRYAIPDEALRSTIKIEDNSTNALRDADFVITTFRVGGMESRVQDERIALKYGVLGQETTGPGGFSMAMRTIPVMLEYLEQMRIVCPNAWIINFANPSGLLTEAIIHLGKWEKVIGICDGPESIRLFAARYLGVEEKEIELDYFGLNYLGWVRKILINGQDILPVFLNQLKPTMSLPGLPFSGQLVKSLGMIPNEYLYYYYYRTTAVDLILKEGQTRGEYLTELNERLTTELKTLQQEKRVGEMWEAYWTYLDERTNTYMHNAKEQLKYEVKSLDADTHMGYANVALNVIEGLLTSKVKAIVNLQNDGSIAGMAADAVVEIPVQIDRGNITRLEVGEIPEHCLALMKQVKQYERLVIEGIQKNSYSKCLMALTIHPLVMDEKYARKILDEYISVYPDFYPQLG